MKGFQVMEDDKVTLCLVSLGFIGSLVKNLTTMGGAFVKSYFHRPSLM